MWFELTTLLIPGENDSAAEIDAMTRWVVEHLGPDVPMRQGDGAVGSGTRGRAEGAEKLQVVVLEEAVGGKDRKVVRAEAGEIAEGGDGADGGAGPRGVQFEEGPEEGTLIAGALKGLKPEVGNGRSVPELAPEKSLCAEPVVGTSAGRRAGDGDLLEQRAEADLLVQEPAVVGGGPSRPGGPGGPGAPGGDGGVGRDI